MNSDPQPIWEGVPANVFTREPFDGTTDLPFFRFPTEKAIVELPTFDRNWAILFGAGVSIDSPSNVPSGYALSRAILAAITLPSETKTLLDLMVLQMYRYSQAAFSDLKGYWSSLKNTTAMLSCCSVFSNYRTPNPNHHALVHLSRQGGLLLTTNFDCLVEAAPAQSSVQIAQVITDNEFASDSATEMSV